jgi:hypothetical protein
MLDLWIFQFWDNWFSIGNIKKPDLSQFIFPSKRWMAPQFDLLYPAELVNRPEALPFVFIFPMQFVIFQKRELLVVK